MLRDDRRNMVGIAVVALLVRALFLLAYKPVLTNDSRSYLDLAHRLAGGNLHGYSGLRTPGYPLLLVLLNYSPRAVWIFQSLLGAATSVLIYRLVRRLSGRPVVALVAALWFATGLTTISSEREVMTETLATFLMTVSGSLALTVLDPPERSLWPSILLGLVLAVFCLIRPDALGVSIYLVIAIAIATRSVARRRGRKQPRARLRSLAAILVPVIVAVIGWASVNKATIGVFTVSTVLGHNMIDHVAPQVTVQHGADHGITAQYVAWRSRLGEVNNISFAAWPDMRRVAHLSYAHLSSRVLSIGLNVIEHHPAAYLSSSVKQWPSFWLLPRYVKELPGTARSAVLGDLASLQRGIEALLGLVFIALCAIDVTLRLRRRPAILSAGAAVLAGAVIVASLQAVFLAYGETGRYGLPYVPLVLVVTFSTLDVLWRRRKTAASSPTRRAPEPVAPG